MLISPECVTPYGSKRATVEDIMTTIIAQNIARNHVLTSAAYLQRLPVLLRADFHLATHMRPEKSRRCPYQRARPACSGGSSLAERR
eukprot:scaffold78309_cov35-Prasinocladus_malaysianus.AAC.1